MMDNLKLCRVGRQRTKKNQAVGKPSRNRQAPSSTVHSHSSAVVAKWNSQLSTEFLPIFRVWLNNDTFDRSIYDFFRFPTLCPSDRHTFRSDLNVHIQKISIKLLRDGEIIMLNWVCDMHSGVSEDSVISSVIPSWHSQLNKITYYTSFGRHIRLRWWMRTCHFFAASLYCTCFKSREKKLNVVDYDRSAK